jgi:CRISPR-associated endoribonuclease Cas6
MQYYNIKVAVLLKNDTQTFENYEKISKLISASMLKDQTLKQLHEENRYKNYVFCNLYPIEKDGIYKAGNIYTFQIRTIDFKLGLKIKQVLNNFQNEEFKVIVSDLETSTQRKINTLATLTPAIITSDKGDYLINNDMQLVKERILANAQKKYNQLYNEKIDMDFIKSIKQTNNKPIKIPYKNINILGYKFEIEVKDDPISQNLAYLILSVGLLEKNAEGFGFCKAK